MEKNYFVTRKTRQIPIMGRRPRRGNLIIHKRWSVAGDWDISSYIRPKLDISLPDTIVKTQGVEKELKEEMLKIRSKRKRITKLLIEGQKARDRQKKKKEKSHAKKNRRKRSQRHR